MKKYKYEKYYYDFEHPLLEMNFMKDCVITGSRIEDGLLIIDYKFPLGVNSISININELVTNEKIPVENYEEIQIRAI